MGLFSHEAAAVDPRDRRVYLTEDSGGDDLPDRLSWGRLYRYTPLGPDDDPLVAGTLDVLVVDGDPYDGSTGPWPVRWSLPIDPLTATAGSRLVGTPFDGGEGCWYDDGSIHFTTKGDDRVWLLDLDAQELSVIYDPSHLGGPGVAPLTGVDNVTVSPGGEVLVAEDGGNLEIVLLRPPASGTGPWEVTPLLRLEGHEGSEITGPAFSPDGRRLYFSSQRGPGPGDKADRRGVTFEVEGPFRTTRPAPAPTTSTTTSTTAAPAPVPPGSTAPASPVSPPGSGGPAAPGPEGGVAGGARLPATGGSVPGWGAALAAGAGTALGALARRARVAADADDGRGSEAEADRRGAAGPEGP